MLIVAYKQVLQSKDINKTKTETNDAWCRSSFETFSIRKEVLYTACQLAVAERLFWQLICALVALAVVERSLLKRG